MTRELELAGAASAGGWLRWRKKHADLPLGSPCPNCETPLQGPYCYNCGQVAEDFHKSIFKLFIETLESLFHLDGRLLKTVPPLILRPGELTRNYLDGKRAYQIPPFRLFLVVLLLIFFVGQATSPKSNVNFKTPSQARTDMLADLKKEGVVVADPGSGRLRLAEGAKLAPAERKAAEKVVERTNEVLDGKVTENQVKSEILPESSVGWINKGLKAIHDDPERFTLILEIWAHRVAILALPVSALLLTVLFIFQRRFYIFDHLVFSMHSLSFQLLLATVLMAAGALLGPVVWWLLLLMPVHLFVHMRGVYQTSVWGTLLRMWVLFVGTSIGFSVLAVLWFFLGLKEMAGH